MKEEWVFGEYLISVDRARLDVEMIWQFLTESYWAEGRSLETVRKSIDCSLPFGLYWNPNGSQTGQQMGFARVITDFATFAYLADVFVLEPFRGRGLGRWLVQTVLAYPELRSIPRWRLVTADAHTLYAQLGFTSLQHPDRHMEILTAEGDRP